MALHKHGKGMLVLIGGLLVVSFLYFVSVMKKDEETQNEEKSEKSNKTNTNSETSSSPIDVTNMECSQSSPKFVCSICGSRTMTIKIEEKIEESTTTTIIEENSNVLPFDNNLRRVPFPEAGVDIVDRKLKNTEESLRKELDEYCSDEGDILTYTESWTDNWLFRKKKKNNKHDNTISTSFKPVSMFVPNTTTKYRAMIGDQNIDEISDLSDDYCSSNDSEVEEEEDDDDATKTTTMTTTRRKVENGMAKYIYDQHSRVFIDGKSKYHIEELRRNNREATTNLPSSRISSVVVRSLDHPNTNSRCPRETDVKGKNVSTSFNLTALSDDVTNENSVKSNRSYYRSELFIETRDVNQNSSLPSLLLACDDKLSDKDFNLFSPPKPGTIADREHRKWQTAVPMENNPYSEENLQKRLMEKKYTPTKYSSASSLLGIARINGLDDGKSSCVDSTTGMLMKNDIDFETTHLLPEKSNVSCDNNNTSIIESEIVSNKSATDKIITMNNETIDLSKKSNTNCNNTPIIIESKKSEIIHCKSLAPEIKSHVKESKSHDIVVEKDEYQTKNKSVKSKCIKVTKKNATINEVDYSCSSSISNSDKEEKISLPSVKKLVEVFSQKQKDITETLNKPKDKNTNHSEQQQQHKFERPKFKQIERTLQQSPRPLHLHSLTARSLSKEFREGLR